MSFRSLFRREKKGPKPPKPKIGDYRIDIDENNAGKFYWELKQYNAVGVDSWKCWKTMRFGTYSCNSFDEALMEACLAFERMKEAELKSSSKILVNDLLELNSEASDES